MTIGIIFVFGMFYNMFFVFSVERPSQVSIFTHLTQWQKEMIDMNDTVDCTVVWYQEQRTPLKKIRLQYAHEMNNSFSLSMTLSHSYSTTELNWNCINYTQTHQTTHNHK